MAAVAMHSRQWDLNVIGVFPLSTLADNSTTTRSALRGYLAGTACCGETPAH
jgi:hypothetical protein